MFWNNIKILFIILQFCIVATLNVDYVFGLNPNSSIRDRHFQKNFNQKYQKSESHLKLTKKFWKTIPYSFKNISFEEANDYSQVEWRELTKKLLLFKYWDLKDDRLELQKLEEDVEVPWQDIFILLNKLYNKGLDGVESLTKEEFEIFDKIINSHKNLLNFFIYKTPYNNLLQIQALFKKFNLDEKDQQSVIKQNVLEDHLDYLLDMCEHLKKWEDCSESVKEIVINLEGQMQQTKQYLREKRQDLVDLYNKAFIYTEKLTMLLHSQAWLSPTLSQDQWRQSGFLQGYSKISPRGGYERENLYLFEIENRLKGFMAFKNANYRSSLQVVRNSNFALYELLKSLKVKLKPINIIVSENMPEDKKELIRRFATETSKVQFVDISSYKEISNEKKIFIFSETDREYLKTIIPNSPNSQKIFYCNQMNPNSSFDFDEKSVPDFIISELTNKDLTGDVSFPCSMYSKSGNAAVGEMRYGGFIDSYALWKFMLLFQNINEDERLPSGASEKPLNEISIGGKNDCISRNLKRYSFLLSKINETLISIPEEYEFIYKTVKTRIENIKLKLTDNIDKLEIRDLFNIEEEYRTLVKMSAYLRIVSMQNSQTETILEELEISLEKKLNKLVYSGENRLKDTLLCQSGMACYRTILDLLKSNSLGKLSILRTRNLYYETSQLARKSSNIQKHMVEKDEIDNIIQQIKTGEHSALFIDPVFNASTGSYPVTDFKELCSKLCKLEYTKPFYCVVDNSILNTGFQLERYLVEKKIPENLFFIQYSSLQKMIQQGLEVSTGGMINVISESESHDKVVKKFRESRKYIGGRLGLRGTLMLDTLGIDKEQIQQRDKKINQNAFELASFLEPYYNVTYPGLKSHPSYNIAVENYDRFGPFIFVSFKGQSFFDNPELLNTLKLEFNKRGIIWHERDSFGFEHLSATTYTFGPLRFSLGQENELQLNAIKDAFKAVAIRNQKKLDNIDLKKTSKSPSVRQTIPIVNTLLTPAPSKSLVELIKVNKFRMKEKDVSENFIDDALKYDNKYLKKKYKDDGEKALVKTNNMYNFAKNVFKAEGVNPLDLKFQWCQQRSIGANNEKDTVYFDEDTWTEGLTPLLKQFVSRIEAYQVFITQVLRKKLEFSNKFDTNIDKGKIAVEIEGIFRALEIFTDDALIEIADELRELNLIYVPDTLEGNHKNVTYLEQIIKDIIEFRKKNKSLDYEHKTLTLLEQVNVIDEGLGKKFNYNIKELLASA